MNRQFSGDIAIISLDFVIICQIICLDFFIFRQIICLENIILENFGAFDFEDKEAGGAQRHVEVCPLYAISQLDALLQRTFRRFEVTP